MWLSFHAQSLLTSILQDVIFAAGGNPVKTEKATPHDLPISEARRILGLSDQSTVTEVHLHAEKISV